MSNTKKDSVIRVRLDDDLPEWVRVKAKEDHRSINAFFNVAIREYRKMKETQHANHA